MTHAWYSASGGGLLATLWTANPLTVALLKPTYVPNLDTHKVWTDVSAQEITGTGYTTGGAVLTGKSVVYDSSADRTNFIANDSTWGPGATFDAAFAVVYDNSGAKPLWSLVDFAATKSVAAGIFTVDWSATGLLYLVPAP